MKNILIFGKTFKAANNWLKEIITSLPYGQIKKYDVAHGMAELVDGTRYYATSEEYSTKGCRFDEVHVQFGVTQNFILQVIYPSLNLRSDGQTQIFYF